MKLFKPTVILLVLLLAAMIIVPMVSAEPDNTIPDKNFVSVEKATSVGNYYVEQISGSMQEYSDWKGATVQKATTYYDFNEKKSAYSFDVLANGQYAGYLMISATRDNYPLLEFSKSKTPDREISNKVKVTELAAADAKLQQATLGAGRPLYLGATFFYMEYPVEKTSAVKSTSQQSQDKILVDLYEMRIIDPNTVASSGNTAVSSEVTAAQNEVRATLDQTSIQKFQQEKKLEARAEWDAIDKEVASSKEKSDSIKTAVTLQGQTKEIIGVPFYNWTHGCSPTSAAMVLGYWRNKGLTRLPSASWPTGDPLNLQLANEMGTDAQGSTWPWMIAYGINRVVAINSGYHYTSSSALVTSYSWPAIQSEIDAERPFVLSMMWGGAPEENPTTPYGFHSVAAVGYSYLSWGSDKYITIHDTWDYTNNRHIRFGNWFLAALNTYERPDYTYTIMSSAGPHGIIDPTGTVQAPTGTQKVFTITPDSGYTVDQILVDNSPTTLNPYTFSDVTSDHTISATFKQVSTSTEWNWATDGWGDWQHTATWSGGSGSEYGPVIVNDGEGNHGEHGSDVSLYAGSTQASVWKTFTDPSGVGWNTITFKGLMTASDVPNGRWMTIDINNNQVFGGTASQIPPGNGVPFEITQSFTQSPTVSVKITNGQSPAWGPRFAMHYYSVKLGRESTTTAIKAQSTPFVIPDGKDLVVNGTSSETTMMK